MDCLLQAVRNGNPVTRRLPRALLSLTLRKNRRITSAGMADDVREKYKFYKVVLTGGPCGGKTTGQARLSTFFENLGWKVYRAPESAHIYMGGGACFADMNQDEVFAFQENIIRTMMLVENTFQGLSTARQQDVLLICDRGVMDGSAYLKPDVWRQMKEKNNWHEVDIRDNRYNQIIHMVSAANGAEDFYSLEGHKTRHEDMDLARDVDQITANAWVGHPYFDVVDNSTGFESKITRMISAVCQRIGIDLGDRLAPNSIKRKYLVTHIPEDSVFPHFQEFTVIHDYLVTPSRKMQARLRKRGQEGLDGVAGNWTYTHTIRRPEIKQESVELRMPITEKDYEILLAQRDSHHFKVFKTRRCFLWHNQYFQLDIYQSPCPEICKGLMLLETFTTKERDAVKLPDFIKIEREVTGDQKYSMFNLSLKDEAYNALESSFISDDG